MTVHSVNCSTLCKATCANVYGSERKEMAFKFYAVLLKEYTHRRDNFSKQYEGDFLYIEQTKQYEYTNIWCQVLHLRYKKIASFKKQVLTLARKIAKFMIL